MSEAFLAIGMRNYWDGYFAGRAAPLGMVPAEVVHAVFYNFADGEVARHIPWVWGKTTPEEAIAVRERGSALALRQLIGELADSSELAQVADLATRAGLSAPVEGRVLYAGLQALDVPEEPVAKLWHAATLLREHRGDGHNAELVANGIGGLRRRGLVDASAGFTDAGRATKSRIESLTDELAAPPYDVLTPDELDQLIAGLEPIAAAVEATDH